MQRIWLITGVSSGLGEALAEAVMASGDFVVGTFRQAAQAAAFDARHEGRGKALLFDAAEPGAGAALMAELRAQFGRLDVLVNNAGLGFVGAVEEAQLEEVRHVFEVNVFGALTLTQAALPLMRQQRSGHIVQISSQAGIKAAAGFGIYNASKFALEGFSEALAQELAPLGIHVSIVEPGPFRTNFAGPALGQAARQIEDYAGTAGLFRQRLSGVHQKQEGDPAKAAQAIIAQVNEPAPSLRLPLGKIAIGSIQMKINSLQADLERHRQTAEAAVFGD